MGIVDPIDEAEDECCDPEPDHNCGQRHCLYQRIRQVGFGGHHWRPSFAEPGSHDEQIGCITQQDHASDDANQVPFQHEIGRRPKHHGYHQGNQEGHRVPSCSLATRRASIRR
jgi:hypothetical protein